MMGRRPEEGIVSKRSTRLQLQRAKLLMPRGNNVSLSPTMNPSPKNYHDFVIENALFMTAT